MLSTHVEASNTTTKDRGGLSSTFYKRTTKGGKDDTLTIVVQTEDDKVFPMLTSYWADRLPQ